MEASSNTPFDAELSALLDNEVAEEDRHRLEGRISGDPQLKSRQEALRRANDYGKRSFEAMLREPVPLDLVRAIRTTPEPRRTIKLQPPPRAVRRIKHTIGLTVACSIAMFGVGGVAGYLLAHRPHIKTFADFTGETASAWLDDVASNYRLFSRQPRHLVEVPASESAHIVEWLMATTGVSFRIPDMSADGLEFLGARLFAAAGRPVGQLVYRNTDGEIISVNFTKSILPLSTPLNETIRDDIGLVVWQGQQASYALSGPSSDAFLETVAKKIAGII